MLREDFVKEYMDVRGKTFKSVTIITAFWKSGCWPINRDVFMDEDYAPSIPTSTSAHYVPSSFPIEIQHLDDETDDEYATYPVASSSNSESDVLCNDGRDDAIDNSENSQTNTTDPPAASQPLSTMVSHHTPLAPRSVVPNSTTLTVCASSALLGPIQPSMSQPKRRGVGC